MIVLAIVIRVRMKAEQIMAIVIRVSVNTVNIEKKKNLRKFTSMTSRPNRVLL